MRVISSSVPLSVSFWVFKHRIWTLHACPLSCYVTITIFPWLIVNLMWNGTKRNENNKISSFSKTEAIRRYPNPIQSNLSHIFVCSSIRISKKKTKTSSTKSSLGIRLLLNQQQNVKSYEMDSDHEGHFEWAFGDILRSSPFFSNFVHFFLHSHLTLVSFISEILLFYVQLSLLYSLSIRFIIRYKMLCSMAFSLFIFNGFMFFFFSVVNCCEWSSVFPSKQMYIL